MGYEGVLRTRLLPPRLPPGCVDRPALVAKARDGLHGRLLAVVAGAGYGKTTLLVQALANTDLPAAWCSCDARLAGSRALLTHLAAGLAERFPGFGARLELAGDAEDQAATLASEVAETIADDFVLVLDDVHLLPADAAGALDPLLHHLGPNAHVAMAGRAPLPFPLARRRLEGLTEIGEAQLAFSDADAQALARSVRADMSDDELANLGTRTEGWAAGLILAAQSARLEGSPGGGEFDYLAEEVMLGQPPDLRDFLLDTAILGRFSPELAAAVTGRPDSRKVLRGLVARHLFTVRLDTEGEWYRYHHLFRELLRRRLDDAGPGRRTEAHRRAASWWMAEGDPAEAVPHHLAAGDAEAAVAALEPVAEGMVLGPQHESLAGWLEVVPRSLWETRPGLVLSNAAVLLARAEHEAAFAEHERGISALVEAGEHEKAAAALLRLQQAMITAGTSPARRAESGRRWSNRIADGAALLPAARILLASAYGYGCRFDEAERELERALALPAARESPVLPLYAAVIRSFYVDFWKARPQDALHSMESAIRGLEANEDADQPAFRLFAQMLRGYMILELGEPTTLAEAGEIMSEFALHGLARALGRAWRWVELGALVIAGRWDDVEARLVPPPSAADPAATSYSYRYRAPAARLAAARGDAAEVRTQIVAARAEMQAFGQAFDDATFLCDFALAATAVGIADVARELASDARAAAQAADSPWLRGRAAIVAAHCADGREGDAMLAEALDLTRRFDLPELWTQRERPIAGALLARAILQGIGPGEAAEGLAVACGGEVLRSVLDAAGKGDSTRRARLAEMIGESPGADLESLDRLLRDRDAAVRDAARQSWARLKERPRAAIAIISLGDLRIERDGMPVPASAFVRQKARALLAALLSAAGPVHRDTLCEWLWPDLPPERAAAALRSTLYDLRRAVEPELEAGSPSSLIASDGDAIRLALGERDRFDAGELIDAATSAPLTAEDVPRLVEVEAMYRGAFLPEWSFEDWTRSMRAQVEEAYSVVLERLSEADLAAGRPGDAIAGLRRLVAREPEREGWHRDLMTAYAAAGERALALRQFHACRAVLRREQGVEPGAETRALYLSLLREDPAATVTV